MRVLPGLIASCYTVSGWYPWENCSPLKGNRGAVDLEKKGGWEGRREVEGGEWTEGRLWSGCIVWKKNKEKGKKVTLTIVSLPGNRTVIKTPPRTIRVDSSASPAEEFTEEPGSPVKARPTCNAHVLGRVSWPGQQSENQADQSIMAAAARATKSDEQGLQARNL